MELKEPELGIMNSMKNLAKKLMPHIISIGDGKCEVSLVKLADTPLLQASINAKFASPIAQMCLSAVVNQFRKKKTRNAIKLGNEGKNEEELKDDWIFVGSEKDLEQEIEEFNRLASEFEEIVNEDDGETSYVNMPQIIEHYLDLLDEEEGLDGDVDDKRKDATVTSSQDNNMNNYAQERVKILKELENRKAELKEQHHEEVLKLENEYAEKFARLAEKYSRIT